MERALKRKNSFNAKAHPSVLTTSRRKMPVLNKCVFDSSNLFQRAE